MTGRDLWLYCDAKLYNLWKAVETGKLIPKDHDGAPINPKIIERLKIRYDLPPLEENCECPRVAYSKKTKFNRVEDINHLQNPHPSEAPNPQGKVSKEPNNTANNKHYNKPPATFTHNFVTLRGIPIAAQNTASGYPLTWKERVYEEVKKWHFDLAAYFQVFDNPSTIEVVTSLPSEITEKPGEFPDELKNLIIHAMPEIESIYVAMKRIGFTNAGSEIKLKEAANNKVAAEKFKIVRRKYLKTKGLFALTVGKERRDFIGKLLKFIVKEKYPKIKTNYQNLYKRYEEIKKAQIKR